MKRKQWYAGHFSQVQRSFFWTSPPQAWTRHDDRCGILLRQLNGKNLTILLTTHYMEEAQSLCNRVALMDHGKLEEINTLSAGLIDGLGKYTVDQETPEGAKSHYFHSREEAISFLSSLDGQCTLRETTLEDVFVRSAQAGI